MAGLEVLVRLVGDASQLNKTLTSGGGDVKAFGKTLDLGMIAKLSAVTAVAGVAAGAIADMTAAALADRDEQEKLALAIESAGAATATSTAQVDAAIAAGQARAFSDSQSREALQSLVTTTGDVTAATALLTTAQDIARFANVDLATAADAVAKANEGQDGALRKLIPGLEKGATATATIANAQAAAAGQADLFAKSTAGQTAIASDSFGELSETLGSVFIPIVDAVVPAIIPVIQALSRIVQALLPILIPLLKTVGQVLGFVAGIIAEAAEELAGLVEWLAKAIGQVGDFLAAINPLKGFTFPSLPGLPGGRSAIPGVGVGALSASALAASGGGHVAPIQVNVYTTGDSMEAEQAVVRALRRTTRLNAAVIPALAGWTTR